MSKRYLDVEYKVRGMEADDFCIPLKDLIKECEAYVAEYGDSVRLGYSYYGYDGGVDFKMFATRKETNKERDTRLVLAKKKRDKAAITIQKSNEKDRKQYEELKLRFENEGP